MLVAGAGMMVQMAASNTLLQTLVDDDKRGRVMSFWTMAFFGMMPFGSLTAGFLGSALARRPPSCGAASPRSSRCPLYARKLPGQRKVARSSTDGLKAL